MRQTIIALMLGCGLCAASPAQTRAGATAIKPCSLLTRELAQMASAGSKQVLDAAGPNEVPLGPSRTACEWGALLLEIDPYTPARLEELRRTHGKNWEVIPGVGDAAYLQNVKDHMATLYVRAGPRTFGVMITIPVGSTAAASKPNIIMVANAIVAKLR